MKQLFALFALFSTFSLYASTVTINDNDITWTYFVADDGTVTIGMGNLDESGTAIPTETPGAITIPPEIDGKPVTTINEWAFHGCSKLTSITIPEGVTEIKWGAFHGCSNLESINIPNTVTSISSYLFSYCNKLTTITVSEDNQSFSSLNGALFNKDKTTLLRGPGSVTSYSVPESVTTIGDHAFDGCRNLTSITIPDSVTIIDTNAFVGCSNLTSITIPESVTTIGYDAFRDCENLESINIPNSVTTIADGTFSGCTNLTSLTASWVPAELKGQIMYMTIPEDVTYIESYWFQGCTSLQSITVDEKNTAYSSLNGALFNKDRTTLLRGPGSETSYSVPNSVTTIDAYAFSGCGNLTSITIPDSVTEIGDYAFENCKSLSSIKLPNKITFIYWGMFSGCSSLTSITIPERVTGIGDEAFRGCSNLTSITIPDYVKTIGNDVFAGCTSLVTLTASWVPEELKGRIMYVTIPEGVKTLKAGAFSSCSALKTVRFPTTLETLTTGTFANCNALEEVVFLGSVPTVTLDTSSDVIFSRGDNGEVKGLYPSEYAAAWEPSIETETATGAWYGLTMKSWGVRISTTILGNGTVTCPDVVEVGKEVTLTATPTDANSTFIGWTGAHTSAEPILTIKPEANIDLVANFVDTALLKAYMGVNGNLSDADIDAIKKEAIEEARDEIVASARDGILEDDEVKQSVLDAAVEEKEVVRMDELLESVKDIALGEPVVEVQDDQVVVSITLNVSEKLGEWKALVPKDATVTVDETTGSIRVVMNIPEGSTASFYKFSVEEQQ